MDITLFLLAAVVFIANLLTLFIIRAYINRQKSIIKAFFHEYTDPRGPDPSLFTEHIDQISGRLASSIVRTLKAQLMNISSINTRQGKAIEGEAAVEAVRGTGGLGELAMNMPQIQKMVQKNPLLAMLAQMALNKSGGAERTPVEAGHPGNGHSGGMTI